MKRIPSWITYTVLRLLVFAVPLAILLLMGVIWWISVIAAALIGLCLSYIFLSRPRNAVSSELYAVRHREKPARSEDDDVEDAAIDAGAESHTQSPGADVPGADVPGAAMPGADIPHADAASHRSDPERGTAA